MKFIAFSNDAWDEVPTKADPEIKILTENSEVLVVHSVEFEADEQNGNDILWVKVGLEE